MTKEIKAFIYKKDFNLLKNNRKIDRSRFYCEEILHKRIGYVSLNDVMEVILQKLDPEDITNDDYSIIKIINSVSWSCLEMYKEALFNFLKEEDDTTIKIKILKKTE